MNLVGIAAEAAGEIRNHRLRELYRNDFVAWQSDVLGFQTYDKMEEISHVSLFGDIPRTAIKSSNGTSKSFTTSAMVLWVGSVHEPGEALSIISAPSLPQVEKVTFRYLKSFKARARERGFVLPGWINESLEWQVKGTEGNISLAYGRKPAAGSEVSTFQGVRSEFGKTFVFFDEAGGMSRGMWTAAEAVLTGASARLIAIGNPDDAGTEWQKVFEDKKYDGDFNRFTISSFDLPTFTGEVVYPEDPEMEKRMLESLTQKSWVEHKKRIWGEQDARYLSKVLGQFPKDGGNGFFTQACINSALDTDIAENSELDMVMGVDIARWGVDESVIATNRGGRIRVEGSWGKCDLVDSARLIHKFAVENNAKEVRIDAAGVGGGVFDMLDRLDEFADAEYDLLGWDNGNSSPDIKQWSNKRAYSHDDLRTQMIEGKIDLDLEDEELIDQMQIISYKFTNRGGIAITPKEDMKTEMGGSPDRVDAVIMAATDLSPWTGNLLNQFAPGTKLVKSPEEFMAGVDTSRWYGGGLSGF